MALTRKKYPRFPEPASPSENHLGHEFSARDDALWFKGRNYLLHTCKLPATLVDSLHAKGHLYTDNEPSPNLVFLHIAAGGKATGASLMDFSKEQPSIRIKGASNSGWFTVGDLTTAHDVIVCENPIDTLSCYSLHQSRDVVAVSCAGTTIPMSLMLQLDERRQNLLVAFNNSPEADRQWLKTWDAVADWPGFSISPLSPILKNWTEDLIQTQTNRHSTGIIP